MRAVTVKYRGFGMRPLRLELLHLVSEFWNRGFYLRVLFFIWSAQTNLEYEGFSD